MRCSQPVWYYHREREVLYCLRCGKGTSPRALHLLAVYLQRGFRAATRRAFGSN